MRFTRFNQCLYSVSLFAASWLTMMVVHELGHVVGGLITGGSVAGVVLHPLSISRTDLVENPCPTIVVWAGFCLIANGAYIAGGALEGIGDCGVMRQTGTPLWVMWGFGLLTVPTGFWLWHRLGSLRDWWQTPERISEQSAWGLFLAVVALVVLMVCFSA